MTHLSIVESTPALNIFQELDAAVLSDADEESGNLCCFLHRAMSSYNTSNSVGLFQKTPHACYDSIYHLASCLRYFSSETFDLWGHWSAAECRALGQTGGGH